MVTKLVAERVAKPVAGRVVIPSRKKGLFWFFCIVYETENL